MSSLVDSIITEAVTPKSDRGRSFTRPLELAGMRYRGEIIAGALMVPESRVIADLLLKRVSEREWHEAIVTQNLLRSRRREMAARVARLIQARLETMDAPLLKMIRDGNGAVATHATLAAAIKHSRLLGDFLLLVVGTQYRQFGEHLSNKQWRDYLVECGERDPGMPQWSESTRERLRSSVFQTIAQAGYIENTRTLRLQTVHVSEQVLHYLSAQREDYVLQCIQVAP